MNKIRSKILLHTCCAPCATASTLRLLKDDYDVALFFSNSNIYPPEEYEKRLINARKLADILDVPLIEDEYDHESWQKWIRGLENEPERGKRCELCFHYSLERASNKARDLDIPYFTTTLTISPYKISPVIFRIARQFPGFIEYNFKKKNGYKESIRLSREWNLYRQKYCGCEYSM
jgi:epoxyqueuosine reductase